MASVELLLQILDLLLQLLLLLLLLLLRCSININTSRSFRITVRRLVGNSLLTMRVN